MCQPAISRKLASSSGRSVSRALACPLSRLSPHLFRGSVLSVFRSRLEPVVPKCGRPMLEPFVKVSERLPLHLFGLQGHSNVGLKELIYHEASERIRRHANS